jgi:signal transduction histidine kinase
MGHDMDTQETTILTLALIAAGVLAVILFYFIFTMIRQHRKTRLLHYEKIEAEVRTLERERLRIANDLHDDLGPMLAAIKFKVTSVEPLHKDDELMIQKVCEHIDEMLTRIREIAFDLMPNALSRKGLIPTLEELIPKAQKMFPLKIHFTYEDASIPLRSDTVIHLYRIILEIIHNTIKHSKATELNMKLSITEKQVIFESKDNGIGFDIIKVNEEQSGGLGLINLQTRTEIMRGEMKVHSYPGGGVWYYLQIPLK